MQFSILSLRISHIIHISHMIKYLWKMSVGGIHPFLTGGRVYNFLAPPVPGYKCLSLYWSPGAHIGGGRVKRAPWWQSVLFLLSWPRYAHKVPRVLRKDLEQGSVPRGLLRQSLQEGREVLSHPGGHLGSTWPCSTLSTQAPHERAPHRASPSLQTPKHDTSLCRPASGPLSRNRSAPCPISRQEQGPEPRAGPLPAPLGGPPTAVTPEIRRGWDGTADGSEAAQGQTFISCSS